MVKKVFGVEPSFGYTQGSMSPITHFLTGWAIANTATSLTKRERAFVTWACVIPDVDGIGIVADWMTRHSDHPLNWWGQYHHVLGHNMGFALVACIFAATFSRHRVTTALLVMVSFHLHLAGDILGGRGPDGDQWPIQYLLPFPNYTQLTWSGQWALNAWPNLLITVGLIVIAIVLTLKRGFSPLEVFSKKADGIFVTTLRSRFG